MNERTNRRFRGAGEGGRTNVLRRALGCMAVLLAAHLWAQAQTFRGGIAGTAADASGAAARAS